MSAAGLAAVSPDELGSDAMQEWLGKSAPELFREYLNPSNVARSALLSKRFLRILNARGNVFALKGSEGCVALLGYEPLEWDSRHFGFPCARLSPYCHTDGLSGNRLSEIHDVMIGHGVELARGNGIRLLQRRLLSRRLDEIRALELSDFHLADNVVTLCGSIKRILATRSKKASGIAYRAARAGDLPALQDITRGAFPYSRFVTDRIFARSLGDELYLKWLAGHFDEASRSSGKASSQEGIIVAVVEGRIAGYAAYGLDQDSKQLFGECIGTIELIVVAPGFQGKGIGQNLFRKAARMLRDRGAEMLESTTWINQRIALASNQSAGLRVCENLLTYHLHL